MSWAGKDNDVLVSDPVPPPIAPAVPTPPPVVGRNRPRRRYRRRGDKCLNCDAAILTTHHYCPNCGQENVSVNISLWEIFREASEEFIRFDSKLIVTLVPLLVRPGKLTQEWAAGRRTKYLSPLKLYLTVTALFFLLIPFLRPVDSIVKTTTTSTTTTSDPDVKSVKTETAGKIQSAQALLNTAFTKSGDKLSPKILKSQSDEPTDKAPTTRSKPLVTSKEVKGKPKDDDSPPGFHSSLDPKAGIYFGSSRPVLTMGKFTKVMNSLKEPANRQQFIEQFIARIPTALFFMLPAYAAVLWALYIRNKRYYVEHLVFALHCHACYFCVFTLLILIPNDSATGLKVIANVIGQGYIAIYSLLAQKRNYGQKWFKTLFKACLLSFAYFVLLVLMFLGSVLAAAASMPG